MRILFLSTNKHYTLLPIGLILGIIFSAVTLQAEDTPSNSDAQVRAQVESLLTKLTLEEKVSLCHGDSTMSINPIPKIGLSSRFWMTDGPNNIRVDLKDDSFDKLKPDSDPSEQSTSLPRLSVLAATWDRDLAWKYGRVIGEEARARGKDMVLGPGVNIMRTPLCGRNMEYFSEDPYLTAQLAVQDIEGIQSCDVADCVKHYALNNQELNRYGVDVEADDRTLHEIYLPAFEAAVKQARVLTVMAAYNRFRGQFCGQNDLLLNRILKKEWEFPGFVVSDWGATHEESAVSGLDVEMNTGNAIHYFKGPLLEAVKSGRVPMNVLDNKVRRILYVMLRIHKIDGRPRLTGSINTPEHQALARKIAEDGIILLKNDQQLLPLDATKIKTLLVIGRNAFDEQCKGGESAAGNPPYEITPIEGLKNLLGPSVKIESDPLDDGFSTIYLRRPASSPGSAAVPSANWNVDYLPVGQVEGQAIKTVPQTGDRLVWQVDHPRSVPDQYFARITAAVPINKVGDYKIRLGHDGGARIRVNGRIIAEDWKSGSYRALTGTYSAFNLDALKLEVEYIHQPPDVSILNLSWHTPATAPEPDLRALAEQAKMFDAVLFFTGDHLDGGGEAAEGEGSDRPSMDLPEGTTEAVTAVLHANPRTVVLNLSGSPVAMPWVDQAPTLVQFGFSGMEVGNALARVLFGQVNPSGKLAYTFSKQLSDSPAHALGNYNWQIVTYAEGVFVGYRWFDAKKIDPLFPFGYGLSYTSFSIKNLKLSSSRVHSGDSVDATVDVSNTGSRDGAEVVQLYVSDPSAKISRPPEELKGFEKVFLKAGETKTVSFTLHPRDFSYWDETSGGWRIDPGGFSILVGDNSRNLHSEASLEIEH